ncbi:hypothetical protein [Actinoplanes nipponensis]|uniref:hypothetical protein n=1 Tax=Actinoplanes nipponensis TaxID=135950 RepID=UPI0031EC1C92
MQVSSTQLHHAVSLMRGLLGAGAGAVTVRATRHRAPLADPLDRAGWTADTGAAAGHHDPGHAGLRRRPVRAVRLHRQPDPQPAPVPPPAGARQPRRAARRRGRHGWPRPTRSCVRRWCATAGPDGLDTGKPLAGRRGAVPQPVRRAAAQRRRDRHRSAAGGHRRLGPRAGPPPYPLAEGAQDHLVALAIEEAAATGRTVTTDVPPWAAPG